MMDDAIDPLRFCIDMRDREHHHAAVKWCAERFGSERRKFYGDLDPHNNGDWRWVRTSPTIFYFRRHDHAVEFKLRWG